MSPFGQIIDTRNTELAPEAETVATASSVPWLTVFQALETVHFSWRPPYTQHMKKSHARSTSMSKAWALIFCGGMEVIQPSWSYPGCLPRHNLIVPSYHESACLVNEHRGTVWSLASTPWAILTAHKATSNSDLQQCVQYTTGSEILNLGTKGGFCLLRTDSIPCNPSAVSTLVAKSGVSACQPKVLVSWMMWYDIHPCWRSEHSSWLNKTLPLAKAKRHSGGKNLLLLELKFRLLSTKGKNYL